MNAPALDEKVVAVDERLRRARIAHAFGGALALAYYAEPRATMDIDINVFVAPSRAKPVLDALGELGVAHDSTSERRAREDGQVRVFWDITPVDIFFSYDPFHDAARRRMREVPFGTSVIPILAPEDLIVCKAVFDRRKDWIDIEQMLFTLAGELEIHEIKAWLARIVGESDQRFERLGELITSIAGE